MKKKKWPLSKEAEKRSKWPTQREVTQESTLVKLLVNGGTMKVEVGGGGIVFLRQSIITQTINPNSHNLF